MIVSRRNGYGEYRWMDGTAYFGMWKDDHMRGSGILGLTNISGDSLQVVERCVRFSSCVV